MKVNVLGTDYEIILKNYSEDESFERNKIDGYCNGYTKEIIVCDLKTKESWKYETINSIKQAQKLILRHEIVHAFLNESGLQDSAFIFDGAWPNCEEMVDWIALQGEKIYNAWSQAEKEFFAPVITFEGGKELAKAVAKEFEKNTKRTMGQCST